MRLRQEDISARAMHDETIILDLRGSRFLSVTGVGTRIVELLSVERELEELVDTIAVEYDAEPAVVRVDVQHFVDRLNSAGLLED